MDTINTNSFIIILNVSYSFLLPFATIFVKMSIFITSSPPAGGFLQSSSNSCPIQT